MMWLRRLGLASLVLNVAIVITGGVVRLTGSGLGCPTWPQCTDTSYVVTSAMGGHGVIEFGNRMLGGVVGLVAIALLVAAVRQRPRDPITLRLAWLTAIGVLGQGLVGGITVLTELNPWTVAAHFLISMLVIAVAYQLWLRVRTHTITPSAVSRPARDLLVLVTAGSGLVLVLGTLVTGSGPHAGDPDTPRMGFDPGTMARLHADAVFLLIGLSVAMWFTLRAVGASGAAIRAVLVLLGAEAAQGVIGFVQYATHLPAFAVGLHLAGACAVWLATLAIWPTLRIRRVTFPTSSGTMTECPPPDPADPPGPRSRRPDPAPAPGR